MSAAIRAGVIALLGMRCSGKTAAGRLLAPMIRRPFVDLDEEVLRFADHSGWHVSSLGDLVERAGWAVFRELEAAALRRILEPEISVVLATGGGAVEREDNRVWLARAALCVYLSVPLEVLAARLRADSVPRPSLLGANAVDELGEVLLRRGPLYRSLAEIVIECGDETPDEIARRIAAELGNAGRASKKAAHGILPWIPA